MKRGKETPRARVLTDEKIRAVYNTGVGWPVEGFVKLLILTGARRNEVAGMQWDEIDLDTKLWIMPAERNKSGRDFEVPLNDMAADIIRNTPRLGDHVFTTNGVRPISGFSKFKLRLDADTGVEDWTLHDLRRTLRTNLAKLGIPRDIAERTLNHAMGELDRVYDHHDYRDEKRRALDAWADRLDLILNGDHGDRVVPLHG